MPAHRLGPRAAHYIRRGFAPSIALELAAAERELNRQQAWARLESISERRRNRLLAMSTKLPERYSTAFRTLLPLLTYDEARDVLSVYRKRSAAAGRPVAASPGSGDPSTTPSTAARDDGGPVPA